MKIFSPLIIFTSLLMSSCAFPSPVASPSLSSSPTSEPTSTSTTTSQIDGWFMYNANHQKFTTYESNVQIDMFLITLYKLTRIYE